MNTLVIIPAYNEEESIVDTVEELTRIVPTIDYVVINDGSSDATAEVCHKHQFPLIDLPINVGLSAGFQTGMKYALQHNYDCALQFDGDGQHDPRYLAPILKELESSGADIVIGSRFFTKKKHMSARMSGSVIIGGLIRLTTGVKLTDPTSGMRAYGRSMIKRFASETDFGPEPDTLAYLMRAGAKVTEVQVSMRERMAGESYLTFSKSLSYMMRTGISILFMQWFR